MKITPTITEPHTGLKLGVEIDTCKSAHVPSGLVNRGIAEINDCVFINCNIRNDETGTYRESNNLHLNR